MLRVELGLTWLLHEIESSYPGPADFPRFTAPVPGNSRDFGFGLMTPGENVGITAETLRATSTYCPPCTFMMGASLDFLNPAIVAINKEKHLSLGSILASTPPRWVHLDGFAIGRRMVTNGEYSMFLKYAVPSQENEEGYTRIYDNPALWRHVWTNLNYKINSIKMPVGEQSGGITTREENYDHVDNFIEAYLLSIRYEIERLLFFEGLHGKHGGPESTEDMYLQKPGDRTKMVKVPKNEMVDSVFRYIQLRAWASAQDEDSYVSRGSKAEADPAQIAGQIDELCADLTGAYMRNVDKRYSQMLSKGAYPVESILLLQRFKQQIQKLDPAKPVPLHAILFPRFWKSPSGLKKQDMFQGDEVPWEEHPVVGISLYEALAYASFLAQRSGLKVTLPNEAQFERAASWPGEPDPEGQICQLDPRKKSIFPWESQHDREFHDYNYYFGQQGQDMENYFLKHQADYGELLENTAKVHPDGNRIYMMLGWGWQWTVDRYAEEELKYSRFDPRNYPVCRDRTYRNTATEKDETVFKYRPNANIESSYFVVRGAPDVIGGPGTATRRFALNPLRGYRNVGFRFAFGQK